MLQVTLRHIKVLMREPHGELTPDTAAPKETAGLSPCTAASLSLPLSPVPKGLDYRGEY